MPSISVERTIGETKNAVLGGLIRYNNEKMGKQNTSGLPSRSVRGKRLSAVSSAKSG